MRLLLFLFATIVVAMTSLSLPAVQGLLTPTPKTIRSLVAESKGKGPVEGTVHLDLVYKAGLTRRHRLDIYEPLASHDESAPLVVFFHGGSWIHGDKATIRIIDRFLRRMREAGYFVAAVNYTTSIYRGIEGPLENAEAAVEWLSERATKFGYDRNRMGLYGVSSGGHVALMLASRISTGGTSGRLPLPAFVFAECPPTDLVAMKQGDAFEHSESFRIFREKRLFSLSPIYHVTADLPPVVLYHGEADRTVHIRQSERYAEALAGVGGEVELVRYPEGNHAFLNLPDEDWYRQETLALDYFERYFSRVATSVSPEA